MMSSGKARPENAELERRVKRRLQRLQRNRWPPSWVVPSLVTLTELQRTHDISASSCRQPTRPTLLQENPSGSSLRPGLFHLPARPPRCVAAPAVDQGLVRVWLAGTDRRRAIFRPLHRLQRVQNTSLSDKAVACVVIKRRSDWIRRAMRSTRCGQGWLPWTQPRYRTIACPLRRTTWPLSAREAAAALGVNERTICRAIARGALAARRYAGVYRIV